MTHGTGEVATRGRAVGAERASADEPTSTAQRWERVGILVRHWFESTGGETSLGSIPARWSLLLTPHGEWQCFLALGAHSWLGNPSEHPDAAVESALSYAGGAL